MFSTFYHLTVREICSNYFIVIPLDTTVGEAQSYFTRHGINELLIGDERNLRGIITVKDALRATCFHDHSYFDKPVIDYFKSSVITVDYFDSAETARNIMRDYAIGRLPVLKEGCVVGIISTQDIMTKFYSQIESIRNGYEYILDQIHEGVCVIDKDNIVRIWSKQASKLYQVDAKEIIGKKIDTLFPTALLTTVAATGQGFNNVVHTPREGAVINISALPLYYEDQLIGAVSTDRDITEIINLTNELDDTKERLNYLEDEMYRFQERMYSFNTIVGESKAIKRTKQIASQAAASKSSILITGDSGTGKELMARAIHVASQRKGLFVAINCSAIPDNLFESEMFGYVGGAFTGALAKGKIGKMELANGGTLFLDEIADMPLSMQAKMLRVIQNKQITRVGDNTPIDLDFRIICATHQDLYEQVKQNMFREDLYYRLKVIEVVIPPLHARREDIPLIAQNFMKKICVENDRPIPNISKEVMKTLIDYHWPGNIRELQNIIEHLVIFAKDTIDCSMVPAHITGGASACKSVASLTYSTNDMERTLISQALEEANGNKAEAARILGLSRPTLYYKIKKLNLDVK